MMKARLAGIGSRVAAGALELGNWGSRWGTHGVVDGSRVDMSVVYVCIYDLFTICLYHVTI